MNSSPMDVLVMMQIDRLRSVESQLLQEVSTISPGGCDEYSKLCLWSSLSEVRARVQRLDRMLDAMSGSAIA